MSKDSMQGIRSVSYEKTPDGQIVRLRVIFGPHYIVELLSEPSGNTQFVIGATHHGIHADASAVGGELDGVINALRGKFPEKKVDNFPIWEGQQL